MISADIVYADHVPPGLERCAQLEGAVQRAASDVRVFVQLIDARNDTQIWSAT